MNTKFNLEIASFKLINQIVEKVEKAKRDFRTHWNKQAERALAKFFGWAFSFRAVQVAVVKEINCGTPIGRMLNDHIEQSMSDEREIDVDDIRRLDRYVEKEIENALENFEIDADNIKGLDDAISESVDNNLKETLQELLKEHSDEITFNVVETIVERLRQ